jgi:predicted nuclease with TOPRIM domain
MSILFSENTYDELINKLKKLQKNYDELEKEVNMLRKWKKAHEETHYNEYYKEVANEEFFEDYHDIML